MSASPSLRFFSPQPQRRLCGRDVTSRRSTIEVPMSSNYSRSKRLALTFSWLLPALLVLLFPHLAYALKLPTREVRLPVDSLTHLALSPDGQQLALANGKNQIWLWSTRSEKITGNIVLDRLMPGFDFQARPLAFSPDSRLLAVVGRDSRGAKTDNGDPAHQPEALVVLCDIATGQIARSLKANCRGVHQLIFAPGGARLLALGNDYRQPRGNIPLILSWNLAAGDEPVEVVPVENLVCMALSPDGAELAWGTSEVRPRPRFDEEEHNARFITSSNFKGVGQLHRTRIARGATQLPLRSESNTFTLTHSLSALAYSHNGRWLAGGSNAGDMTLWETGSYAPVWTQHHDEYTNWISTDSWETWIAFSGDDKLLGFNRVFWHVASGAIVLPTPTGGNRLPTVFSATDRTLYSIAGPSRSRLYIVELDNLKLPYDPAPPSALELATKHRFLTAHTGEVQGLAFTLDGNNLASFDSVTLNSTQSSNLLLWDVPSGSHRVVSRVPGERFLPIVYGDSAKQGWHTAGQSEHIVALSPNAVWAAVLLNRAIIKLLDVRSGEVLRTFATNRTDLETLGIDDVLISEDGAIVIDKATEADHKTNDTQSVYRVWDIATGLLQRRLKSFGKPFLSQDGSLLASFRDNTVTVQEVLTGKVLRSFATSFGYGDLEVLAISPDLQTIACGGLTPSSFGGHVRAPGCIEIRERTTGHLRRSLYHSGRVTTLSFTPDGQFLVAGSGAKVRPSMADTDFPRYNEVRMWRVKSGQQVGQYRCGSLIKALAVGINPRVFTLDTWGSPPEMDDFVVALGHDFDTSITLWNWRPPPAPQTPPNAVPALPFNGVAISTPPAAPPPSPGLPGTVVALSKHSFPVEYLSFTEDGKRLATVDAGGNVYFWNASTGEWLRSAFAIPVLLGKSTALNSNANLLATSGQGAVSEEVWLWDLTSGDLRHYFRVDAGAVSAVALSNDGALLACGTTLGGLTIWRTADGSILRTFKTAGAAISALAFAPDGKVLAVGRPSNVVEMWPADAATPLVSLRGEGTMIHSLCWSRDGSVLGSAGADDHVQAWNVDTGQIAFRGKRLDVSGLVRGRTLALSPDGATLVCDGQFWQMASGQLLKVIDYWDRQYWSGPEPLAFSPDGSRVATGGRDGVVHLWPVP